MTACGQIPVPAGTSARASSSQGPRRMLSFLPILPQIPCCPECGTRSHKGSGEACESAPNRGGVRFPTHRAKGRGLERLVLCPDRRVGSGLDNRLDRCHHYRRVCILESENRKRKTRLGTALKSTFTRSGPVVWILGCPSYPTRAHRSHRDADITLIAPETARTPSAPRSPGGKSPRSGRSRTLRAATRGPGST